MVDAGGALSPELLRPLVCNYRLLVELCAYGIIISSKLWISLMNRITSSANSGATSTIIITGAMYWLMAGQSGVWSAPSSCDLFEMLWGGLRAIIALWRETSWC